MLKRSIKKISISAVIQYVILFGSACFLGYTVKTSAQEVITVGYEDYKVKSTYTYIDFKKRQEHMLVQNPPGNTPYSVGGSCSLLVEDESGVRTLN